MIKQIEEKRADIALICSQLRVKRLDVFGSAATVSFDPAHSDLDFLVDFDPMLPREHADAYFDLLAKLEDMFGRPVDLVELAAVNNPYFLEAVQETRTCLYAA